MNTRKILFTLSVISVGVFTACRDESLYPLPYNDRETGAYLRLVRQTSNVIDVNNLAGSGLDAVFEFVDASDAENLQDVQFFARNRRGGVQGAEVLVTTVDASAFQPVPEPTYSVYKRANVRITAPQTSTALGLGSFLAGDVVTYRSVIRLKDGRTFTNTNASSDLIGGQFYSSSFVYTLTAVALTAGSWVGTYSLTQNAIWSPNHSAELHALAYPANLNTVLFPNQTVTLSIPANGLSTERQFQVSYRGQNVTMRINLENGTVFVPLQNTGVDCTAEREIYWVTPTGGSFPGTASLPAGLPQASTPNRGTYTTSQTGLVAGQVMTLGVDDDADEYGRRNGYCTWTRRVRLTLTKL